MRKKIDLHGYEPPIFDVLDAKEIGRGGEHRKTFCGKGIQCGEGVTCQNVGSTCHIDGFYCGVGMGRFDHAQEDTEDTAEKTEESD